MFSIFTNIADIVTYGWLDLAYETHFAHSVHFFVEDVLKLFFLLSVLMFCIGFLRSWLKPEKIRAFIEGKPLVVAYFLAASLGALTPFCSCSSIPLFIAFLSTGIPFGVTMAFLITSPMVNEVAAVLFGEAIGWQFTFAYVATGMVVGMFGGALVDFLKLEKWVEPFVFETTGEVKKCCGGKIVTLQDRAAASWSEVKKTLKQVWLYIFIGVGLGAAIHGFVPQEWFVENAGADQWYAVPLAVILAIPLYSNVTGTIPMAEVLIAKGLPIGTTLAFIMSTVAISLPELVILRRVLLVPMLAFFTAYIALAFIVVGYLFNAMW